MYHYKATIAYDGSGFYGMAPQPGARTVSSVLTEAINAAFNAATYVKYAGRTDAGVHALGQVISFKLPHKIAAKKVMQAINGRLPEDIRVLSLSAIEAGFEPRHNAKGKVYRYVINTGTYDPLSARYVYQLCQPLDLVKLRQASKVLLGEHDFLSFSSDERGNTLRSIEKITARKKGDLVEITFFGRSFLRYMVRMMVGSLVQVGLGRSDSKRIKELLDHPKKGSSNRNAPACGLTLVKVSY